MKVFLLLSITITATASVLPELSNVRSFGITNAYIMETEKSANEDSRIVGGSQSPQGLFPYNGGIIVSWTNGLTSICGCSLIRNDRSLTAAHCWWDGTYQARQFTLVYGTVNLFSGGLRVITSDVHMHPNWNWTTHHNDIAVINHAHIAYTNNIQPIALPSGSEQSNTFTGFTGVVSGFGMNSDSQTGVPTNQTLHHLSVQIITNSVCQATYGNAVQASTMCTSGAGNRGTCGGDSGGPLAVQSNNRNILVGITSFHAGYCQRGYPSGYTRITSHISWIMSRL